MKILQVIPFFSPGFGGSVTQTTITSIELTKRGHEVTIISTDLNKDESFVNKVRDDGVDVILFPSIINIGLLIYSPLMKKWLKDNLQNYDIIHMQQYRAYQNSITRKFGLKQNIPYIVQARGSVLPFFEKQLLKRVYDIVWGNRILQDANKVIALTKTEAEQYKKMGVTENKIIIIPNGLNLSNFSNLPEKRIFRHKYGISDNEQIILFLGRIHKIKGIDLLVTAYSNLIREMPNVRLVIVGPDGGYLSTIKSQIQKEKLDNNILFTGPLYDRDKLEAYVDADVYVLPSRYETFPNTVLEAWACKTPVIMTGICGLNEIGKDASITVEYNKNELLIAIEQILNKKVNIEQIVERGNKLVETELNINYCIGEIIYLYGKILKEGF